MAKFIASFAISFMFFGLLLGGYLQHQERRQEPPFTPEEAAWLTKARDAMDLCKATAPPGATCFWAVHRVVPKSGGVRL